MLSRKWLSSIVIFLTVTLLATGCGLFGPEDEVSQPIDPPPVNEMQDENSEVTIDVTGEGVSTEIEQQASEEVVNGVFEGELYLFDPQGNVVPLTMSIPKKEEIATQVLTYMIKGGPVESMLPEGFSAVLPEGTKILGINIKNGVATVDFSPQFSNYEPEQEQGIVEAITWALTQFDSVESVKIWINGYPQEVMPVDGTPITSMSRDNGINIELAHNVEIGNTSKVTLYFLSETEDLTYFVPVTRIIPRSINIAMDTLDQLIKGPKQGSNLFSGILPSTRVIEATMQNNIVVANFDQTLLDYNSGSASPDAVRSIVLSLAENTGAKQVQLQVEGKANFMAGDMDLSNPVVRPAKINTYSF